ncbi:unnamed protein product [Ambrosiozyma monospora]|uniref:Unnamed protein product n=1 Tax=Ambrosiozyma monospora TaxID=43982 RepID=A0ACB5TLB3_AMBMO|nr:unnamed protein product [Ambrosiozyma monospora]
MAQSPAFSQISNGSFASFGSHFRSKSYGDFEKVSSAQQYHQQQQQSQQTPQQQLQQKSKSQPAHATPVQQPVQQESNKFNKKTAKEKKERKEKGRSFFSSWKRKSMSFGQPLDDISNTNNNSSNTTASPATPAQSNVRQHKHTFSSLFRTKSTEQLSNHAKHQSMPLLSTGSGATGSVKPSGKENTKPSSTTTTVPTASASSAVPTQATPAQTTSRKSSLLGTYGFDEDAQTEHHNQGIVLSTPIIPSSTTPTATPLGLITPSSATATTPTASTPVYGVSKVMAKARAHTGTSGVHKHTQAELSEASPFEQPLGMDNENGDAEEVLKPSLTPVQEPVREVFSLSENERRVTSTASKSIVPVSDDGDDGSGAGDDGLIDSVVARGANMNQQ